jgi:hypothetical protein
MGAELEVHYVETLLAGEIIDNIEAGLANFRAVAASLQSTAVG